MSDREGESELIGHLKCCSTIAAPLLAHRQTAEYANGKEEYGTAETQRRERVFQIANTARGTSSNDYDLGRQRWLHHNANWRRLECTIVGHVCRRYRGAMVYTGYKPRICK